MGMDMREQAQVDAGGGRQQARSQVEGHAVDVNAQQIAQAHIGFGH